MKMKIEIRDKWTAALESGEFQQGYAHLNCEGKFCCLGVLTELYRREMGYGQWVNADALSPGLAFTTGGFREDQVLPSAVAAWAGFSDSLNPIVSPPREDPDNPRERDTSEDQVGGNDTLASLNDAGYSFRQIAEIIRRDL